MSGRHWAQTVYRLGQWTGAVAAGAIALITVGDVLMRNVFNHGIFGGAEVTNAMLAILVGAGLIVVSGLRLHICVDLFDAPLRKHLPKAYPRWVWLGEVMGIAALSGLLMHHAWQTIAFGEVTAVLGFPVGWVFAAVALLTLAALAVLLSGWVLPAEHQSDTI